MQTSLQTQCNQKQLKTLDISRNIISGTTNVAMIELGLTIKNTLESPNMKSIFKGDNGQIGFSVVNILVKRFMESFGFSTKMTETQLEVLTVDTLEKFSYESLEDIILFFKMARTGQFGSTMRGVDSNLIYGDWFPKYLELKAEEREKAYSKEKISYVRDELTVEDVKRAYAKTQKKEITFVDQVIEYVEKITNGIDRDQLEVLIDEWMNDPQKKPYIYHLNKKRLTIK